MNTQSIEAPPLASTWPEISLVIPLFNEAENVLPLYEAVAGAMQELPRSWEVIFVDDGSTDTTYEQLRQLSEHDAHVQVLQLRRNFGQTAAMVAGFDHASGEIIVALDGDLQNDPRDIHLLIAKLDEGYDVVSGWRLHRQDGFWLRRLPSRIANWVISRTTGTHLHDYGCTLKAYRTAVIREVRLYGDMHRFIPAVVGGNGARIAELPVHHAPRVRGTSKYGLSRTIRVLLDLVMIKFFLSFATTPLRVFGTVGLFTFLPGLFICVYLTLTRLLWHQDLASRPLLLLGVLLTIVGIQFVSIGLLAEVQMRTYHESAHKPTYTIRTILGGKPTATPVAKAS